jgi:apolipoprotein N-acyltransferase
MRGLTARFRFRYKARVSLRFTPFHLRIAIAFAAGAALHYAVGLRPVWWLVWLAPIPLLVIAFRNSFRDASWMIAMAALIASAGNLRYFLLVMPAPAAVLSVAAQALLWVFLITATRRVVLRYRVWWTVLVYPVLWVAMDTLMAALLPDGNWGSLAYSQGDRLPVLQIASLFGVSGVLFLLSLVPSAVALAIAFGRGLRSGWVAYGLTAVLLAAALVYGWARLRTPVIGAETRFGLVSIDDVMGPGAVEKILGEYEQRVSAMAALGAQIVVLPEKIAMISPQIEAAWQERFSAVARRNHIWLEVGIGIDDGRSPVNQEWLFSPDGALALDYRKHHMAPPERRRHYNPGSDYSLTQIGGRNYGLAICKDMHFAALGLAYGQRQASVMLVPAWDFDYLDGWMESRTTVLRGIENGYSIVRASREGLLTVSDPYGRILAETASSGLPGSSLLATLTVAEPVGTLYTRIGNLLGWISVAAAVIFLVLGRGWGSRQKAKAADALQSG